MMLIDMTKDLAPILYGLNVALVISAVGLLSRTAVSTWFRSLGRIERPRPQLTLHRPALAR
jgi:hypothetical protein